MPQPPRTPLTMERLLARYEHGQIGRLHRWLTTPPAELRPEYRDFYALSNCIHALGLLAHLWFLVVFAGLGMWLLVATNALGVALFATTLWWSKSGLLNLALLAAGPLVGSQQTLAVLAVGTAAGFQHYVLILAVGTLFYRHIPLQTRVGMAILPIVGYVVLIIGGMHITPWYELSPLVRDGLAAMNTVFFSVILLGICIYFQHTVEQARILAEKLGHSKTLFLANMSHELRTPLNAILGFAQILRRSTGLDERDRRNLATIDRSGEHLLDLINDILDMSKLEEGKLELERAPCDLHRLLDDVHAMFSLVARDKLLALDLERAPDVPRWVEADELRLRQVLINLLGNALKFTERGGVRLTVARAAPAEPATKRIGGGTSRHARPVDRLAFTVSDSGGGIAPEELGDLFQLFTQTELGRRSRRGTGLGLALSKRFVELMGGTIGVDSELGRGSTFWFTVPLPPSLAQSSSSVRLAVIGPGAGKRMLVVDDNPENRDVLLQFLGGLGYEVASADDGAAAVEKWRSFAPDVTWMDLRMPVMDGYEACRAIHRDARAAGKPEPVVVAITASSLETGRAQMSDAGFAAWVGKPFRESEIHAILLRHLARPAPVEPEPSATATPAAGAAPPATAGPTMAERAATLDAALRATLADAAALADFDAVQTALPALAAADGELARQVGAWCDEYRFERIQELFAP